MTYIVGVSGQINSGKGAVADYLCSEYGFISFAFADYLKKAAQDLFAIPEEELWGPSQARTPRTRRILQTFGTEFGRNFDPMVWIRKLTLRVGCWRKTGKDIINLVPDGDKDAPIVITDVRFPNEAQEITRVLLGRIMRIRRPDNYVDTSEEFRKHSSETSVDEISSDLISATITNSGTLAELHMKVRATLEEFTDGTALRSRAS